MLAVAISPSDAKGLVMRYSERGKLNLSWLVLVKSDDTELKAKAANLIREISKNYSP